MSPIRYRDRDSSAAGTLLVTVGALAGLAAGILLAQRYGGLSGLSTRVRDRLGSRFGTDEAEEGGEEMQSPRGFDAPEYDEGDDAYDDGSDEALEERVLEAFRNDPVLSERAVDIGAIGSGIIELTGWVQAEDETAHAVTVTRGVPGVVTVVNRLTVREEEERFEESGRRYESGDERATPGHWEGQGVGTGRPRQGTSADPGRHADPKPVLEDRWQREGHALRVAAEETEGLAERRTTGKEQIQGDRTGGAPVAPSGVPKGDHVADPAAAEPVLRESTGRDHTIRAD
jgi:hypothetical protein